MIMNKVSRKFVNHIGIIVALRCLFRLRVAPYEQREMTPGARESKSRPGSAARRVKHIVQLNVCCPWWYQKVSESLSSGV